jgi:hypothetical protein
MPIVDAVSALEYAARSPFAQMERSFENREWTRINANEMQTGHSFRGLRGWARMIFFCHSEPSEESR